MQEIKHKELGQCAPYFQKALWFPLIAIAAAVGAAIVVILIDLAVAYFGIGVF